MLAIFASAETIGRSILTTPGVPAGRVAALRAAFDAMLKDPDFLAEVFTTETELAPMSGGAVQAQIAGTRDVPSAVPARARASVRR